MAVLDAALMSELETLVGPGQVSTERGELDAHSRDCWPRLMMAERAGEHLPPPGAVVWPTSTTEVAAVYAWATRRGVPVVPFGGGGGVVGGATPVPGCVMIDTKRLSAIVDLDETAGLVTVQPGVIGQSLEEWLGARGWTLGHSPSSVTISSVGGFAAARSAGQTSTKYGPFAAMVAGCEAVLPTGTVVRRRAQPASAAGPDLTGVLLGAEGTLGLLTELTLRVHPKPEAMAFRGFRLPRFQDGLTAIRALLRTGLRPAVVRLSDDVETQLTQPDVGGCLLVVVSEGWGPLVDLEARAAREIMTAHGGDDLGEEPGRHWYAHRYDVSYELAYYLKPGGKLGDAVALDTCELAAPWSALHEAYDTVREAIAEHMDVVLCHASHAYADGAALYFTMVAAGHGAAEGEDAEGIARQRYDAAWGAAMTAATEAGATITHHHGIGVLRAPWLAAELGEGGVDLLRRIKAAVDPAGIANPGKLGLEGVTR